MKKTSIPYNYNGRLATLLAENFHLNLAKNMEANKT